VAEAAQSTSHGAGDSQKAARELARMSGELKDLTAKFKFEREQAHTGWLADTGLCFVVRRSCEPPD